MKEKIQSELTHCREKIGRIERQLEEFNKIFEAGEDLTVPQTIQRERLLQERSSLIYFISALDYIMIHEK